MEEHPDGCPGCADCFFDWERHHEQRQIDEQQRQEDLAEQIEALMPCKIAEVDETAVV